MTRLLLVGAGYMGQGYIEAARARGISVTLLEGPQHQERLSPLVDEFVAVEPRDDDDWCRQVLRAAGAAPVDAVLGFGEAHVIGAAFVAAHLGLPGPGQAAARISRDKVLQRTCLESAGISQPRFTMIDRAGILRDDITYPAVLKSTRGSGSSGVEQVRDRDELSRALAGRVADADPDEEYLVEQMIDGPEFSWEALVSFGEVIFENVTSKRTTGPPQFVETGHIVGWQLPMEQASAVRDMCRAVTRAMGMRDGIMHLEFRLDGNGPSVIEVAVRAPGDWIMDAIALAHDIDLFAAMLDIALGDRPCVFGSGLAPVRSAGTWLPVAPAGVIRSITGWSDVANDPATVRADLLVWPGTAHVTARSSADRLGCAVVTGRSADEVQQALARFDACVHIEMDARAAPKGHHG